MEVGAEFHQPLRFPGHFWDAELGLHYNRFRYYSPELGQYLESDPWGLAGGLNPYTYTSNPLVQADLRGLSSDCTGSEQPPPPREPGADGEDIASTPRASAADPPASARPKSLDEMSQEELQSHCDRRAAELREVFRQADSEGEKSTTLSVGVVEGENGRRVVVTTSADDQELQHNVLAALHPNEDFRQTEPTIVRDPRRPNPNYDPNPNRRPDPRNNPRTVTDPMIVDPRTGRTTAYEKAVNGRPPSGTLHHAEQRMESSAAQRGERVLAQAPTKPCCHGCRVNLGAEGLAKIPEHLRGER